MEHVVALLIVIIVAVIIVVASRSRYEETVWPGQRRRSYANHAEGEVDRILASLADELGGHEFHDIMIESGNSSVQIDNMLLTRKALYVIETKDYSGWVFGSQHNKSWTQVFTHYKARTSGNNYTKSGVSKYRFYNPIKQNSTHIQVIDRVTNIGKLIPIYNIVVFSNRSTLKDVSHNNTVAVIQTFQLCEHIRRIDQSLSYELTVSRQATIVDAIYHLNVIDPERRFDHIRRVQQKQSSQNSSKYWH